MCARGLGEYLAASASGTVSGGDPFLRARAASRKLGARLRTYEVQRDHAWDAPTQVMVTTDGALSDAEMRARFAAAGGRLTSTYGRVVAIDVPANRLGCVADLDFVVTLDLPASASIH